MTGRLPPALRALDGPYAHPDALRTGSPRCIDPAWDRERQVLLGLGGTILLLDHDRL